MRPSSATVTDTGHLNRFCGSIAVISRSLIAIRFVIMYPRAWSDSVASPMNFSTNRPDELNNCTR